MPDSSQEGVSDLRTGHSRRAFLKVGAASVATSAGFSQALLAGAEEAGADDGGKPVPDVLTGSTLAQVIAVGDSSLGLMVRPNSRTLDADHVDAAVAAFGTGILAQPDEEAHAIEPDGGVGRWEVGHVAVIEETWTGRSWVRQGIDRLYVEILPQRVRSRSSSDLRTEIGLLLLGPEAEPWPGTTPEGATGIPLKLIEPGQVVAGIGYLSGDGRATAVSRLVVQEPS